MSRIRQIEAFVEVVRQGGFSAAAQTLFTTQSAVSKSVKLLEEELGFLLIERLGHRSTLTQAGEVVYRHGVKLLATQDDMEAELRDLAGLKDGTLRLGLSPVGSDILYAPLFTIYRKRYPGVKVSLVETGSDSLKDLVRDGQLDFAGTLLPVSSEFDFHMVRKEPLVCVLPAKHRLANAGALSLKELKDEPFILFETGFALHRIMMEASRKRNFEPKVIAQSTQIDFMIQLVGAGLGVAFLPRMIAAQRETKAVKSVLLNEPGTQWRMAMTWRRGGYLSAAAKAWLNLVKEIHTT